MNDTRLKEIADIKKITQGKMQDKLFKNLNTGDKDLLLEAVCKLLGLIKG